MKYIVVHAGRRDDYQVALALAKANALHCLLTDFYAPLDAFAIRSILNCVPRSVQNTVAKRYKVGLPSTLVCTSVLATIYALLFSVTKNIKYSALKDKALGVAARKLSLKYKIPIISMNTYAKYAFENNSIQPKILFQFHPHTTFVKNILTEEMQRNPVSKKSLLQEYEFSVPDGILQDLAKEIHLADQIICASSITAISLQQEGINADRIKVIPYGVETALYPYKKREILKKEAVFNVIFIGSLNQRKGITYLLEALDGMPNVALHIVGRGIFDENLLDNYQVLIHLHKNISQEEMVSLLHQSHCFVLPSLVEGFGQVILEAMATGIPVLASENTIALDIIQDGENGFVVPIRNAAAIKEKIETLIAHPELVGRLGDNGFKTAQNLNWSTFRKNLVNHLQNIS
ncbi:glycosyltransferase family 4 protein [Flavobacterium sp. GT2N3]|uniref:glycosyltransferase family 4 protein n=1 Tax=unclassified Flavobacterium TaxID=196869 RepID=UPI003AACD9F6